MFSAPVIGTGPNLLGRLLEAVTGISASLELAHELKGLNSDQARLLLEQRGLISGPNWQLPKPARIPVRLLSRLIGPWGLIPKPETMRDLQRACIDCSERSRCEREHELGQAHATYHSFCPNAPALDTLCHEGVVAGAVSR
jgi:hypothetical protein